MRKTLLALTMGDPAGVGPEIVARACLDPTVREMCLPLVVGHVDVLRRAIGECGLAGAVRAVDDASQARDDDDGGITCLHIGADDVLDAPRAQVDARSGRAAYESVVEAARLALSGDVDGIVTAPLNKKALAAAGLKYPGHTELLAELCGVERFAMMLYLGAGERVRAPYGLGVAHVTLHMALSDVLDHLSTSAVLEKICLCDNVMRRFGAAAPRIGVAALNPHAGEQGLFGDEEGRIIAPAVEMAAADGIAVTGPVPADALMVRAAGGEFDGVVAMYHDQGHIAMKLLGMFEAVNITLGLPIVRTSVAHGTAFDLVGQSSATSKTSAATTTSATSRTSATRRSSASITSMIAAIRVASVLAARPAVGQTS